ncbi:lipid-transfer protein [Striga asiatica]|uniref:Lipid-transfer protein n=1 Tax=Striga asiatica TaxID=4170 RepID=A0A5A7PHX2_STRAF|nr:lipid-transfer protein [Striga asiatica]
MAIQYSRPSISTAVVLILVSTSPTLLSVNSQVLGCSLMGIDHQNCLVPSTQRTPFSIGSCCTTLNQVLEAGYYCLCTLLGPSSSYPVFSAELQISFSNCYIAVPPLTHCHDPKRAAMALPPASPVFPALKPPESAIDDQEFVPLPPEVSENLNSGVVDGGSVLNSSQLPMIGIPKCWNHIKSDAKNWTNSKNMIVLVISLWLFIRRGI